MSSKLSTELTTPDLEDYYLDDDELLEEIEDKDVCGDFVSNASVIESQSLTFEYQIERTLSASVEQDTIPLSPDEYRRLEGDRVPYVERFAHAPDDFSDTEVLYIERNVEVRDCPVCLGRGNETCDDCGGRGEYPCTTCNTTGDAGCETCRGTGRFECSTCGGTNTRGCDRCDGTGEVMCPQCDGTTLADCQCVNQPGEPGMAYKKAHTQRQEWSAGQGTQSLSGSESEILKTCFLCNGSGTEDCTACTNGTKVCPECRGKSTVSCRDCQDGKRMCRQCGGNPDGNCTDCHGSGTIVCRSCNNRGNNPCDKCGQSGSVYYARQGTVKYTGNKTVDWERDRGERRDLISKGIRLKRAINREDGVTRSTTERSEPRPDGGTVRTEHERRYIPVQLLSYEYDGSKGDIVKVGEETYGRPVTAALTDRGRQKRYLEYAIGGLAILIGFCILVYLFFFF